LAPWFDDSCRKAKRAWQTTVRAAGRHSDAAAQAFARYQECTTAARAAFSAQLPDQLKFRPREFWSQLKPRHTTGDSVAPGVFAAHCERLYYQPDLGNNVSAAPPLLDMADITPEEVASALQRYNGQASPGLCPLPT
jgi:hypothetical protein